MRGDIAGAKVFSDQLPVGPLRQEIPEVHHHGKIGEFPGLDSAVHGRPVRKLIVCGLHAYHYVLMFGGHRRDLFWLEVGAYLFGDIRHHPQPRDIDHGQNARAHAIDHRVPEGFEVAPTRAAGIDHRRDAGSKAEGIRLHAVVARPGVANPRGMEHMHVHIDQAGGHIEAGDIDRLAGPRRIDGRRNFGDSARLHSHVPQAVDVIARIDDVPAL